MSISAVPVLPSRWPIDNRDIDAADLPELLAVPGALEEDGATTENVA